MPDSPEIRVDENAPHVVVIGGGATGCAVARDLILRGFRITLVEYGDLGSGTSGRFHGMLQSGARYAVSDTDYAAECMRERKIVAELVPDVVEPCGGLFVALPEDPPAFADRFHESCEAAGLPVAELDPEEVMRSEPHISRHVRRAFGVPDATINPWLLINALAADIRLRGGTILTRHQVTDIAIGGAGGAAVRVAGRAGVQTLEANIVVNASGSWSSRIASLVGQQVDLQLTKGSIIVFAHRLVGSIINRCRPPSGHDIMVPTGTVSLFGTTSRVVDDPDTTLVTPAEIQELLAGAQPLVPAIRQYRALRAWAGVRPLVKPPDWPAGDPLPRRHKVIDHGDQGLDGFFTVCGGSLTTHRSMAEDLGNHLCRHLGLNRPSLSAKTALLGQRSRKPWRPVDRYEDNEVEARRGPSVCDCEQLSLAALASLVADEEVQTLHDLRRRARLGFGPCQGTFCANRAASLLAEARPDMAPNEDLERFWRERLKGMVPTAWNEQARQVLLSDWVNRGVLGLRLTSGECQIEDRR